jgi:hypothetical protein
MGTIVPRNSVDHQTITYKQFILFYAAHISLFLPVISSHIHIQLAGNGLPMGWAEDWVQAGHLQLQRRHRSWR